MLQDGLNADSYQGTRRRASLAALVGVNVLPLLGVILLDWDVAALMLLYWSENLVIGFYTLVFPQLLFNVAGQVFTYASTEWLVTFICDNTARTVPETILASAILW